MGLVLYTMLVGHLVGYRHEYLKIGTTLATTIIIKLVVKQANKDHATMIGIGGGFVTVTKVLELFEKMTKRGFDGGVAGTTDCGDGLVAEMFEKILASLKENLTLHD